MYKLINSKRTALYLNATGYGKEIGIINVDDNFN